MRHGGRGGCSFVTWSAEMEGKMVVNNKKDHARST